MFLLLLLGYQLKDQYLEDLGAADWVRPVMEQGCKWFDCEVPHRGDIGSLELLETRINPHPETPGALRMSASIINRADFSQAYPRLQITLTNKIGRIVGRLDYGAQEYLGVEYVNRKSLAPGVVEFIALDLAHPDESAVGYEVEIVAGG